MVPSDHDIIHLLKETFVSNPTLTLPAIEALIVVTTHYPRVTKINFRRLLNTREAIHSGLRYREIPNTSSIGPRITILIFAEIGSLPAAMMQSSSNAMTTDPFSNQAVILGAAQEPRDTDPTGVSQNSQVHQVQSSSSSSHGQADQSYDSSAVICDDDSDWVSFDPSIADDDDPMPSSMDPNTSNRLILAKVVKRLEILSSHILVLHKTILSAQVASPQLNIIPPVGSTAGFASAALGSHSCRIVVRDICEKLIELRDQGHISQHYVNLLMFSPTLTRSGSEPSPNLMLTYLFIKLSIPPTIELEQCKEITKKIQYSWKKIRAEEIVLNRVQRPTVVPASIRLQGGRPMVFHFRQALDSLARRELTIDSPLLAYCNRILRELAADEDVDPTRTPLPQTQAPLEGGVYSDPANIFTTGIHMEPFAGPPSLQEVPGTEEMDSAKRLVPDDQGAAAKRNVRQRKD